MMGVNDIYGFIRWESKSTYDDMNLVRLEKTNNGNWAIYYNGNHTGLFLPKSEVSQDAVDFINKNNI